MDVSIVIPTYNEKENIQILLKKINREFKENKIKGEIIVVDDCSPDGTGKLVENLRKKQKNIKIIHRKGKLGLSSAVFEGFKISKGNVLGVIDADLSHPAEKIPEMFEIIKNKKADFVIGSRYIKGGKIEGWGLKRMAMSKVATLLARPFTKVKDPMTGFFLIRKECVEKKEFNSKGFKILLELILKADYEKIKEVPIIFVNRTEGKSKAESKEIFHYLKNLVGYWPYRRKVIDEFFKFGLIGILGTLVNLFILYVFTEFAGIFYLISAIIAFFVAATHNFILNKIWTFKEKINYLFTKKYIQFLIVSISSLVINLIFLYIFTEFFNIYYMVSQALAIGVSFIANFIGNKIWTFKK